MKRVRPSRVSGWQSLPTRALAAAGPVLLLAFSAGCSGSSINPAVPRRQGTIRIGLMWPTSGVLAVAGADFMNGWELYLKQHDNKLGGFEVTTTLVDEADGRQAARDGITKLIEQDHVDVMVGTVSTDAMMAVLQATAQVLDMAITAAGPNPTASSINAAISHIGAIPSPRGDWRFAADHAPTAPWYLRQVRSGGGGRTNVIVQPLAVLGDQNPGAHQ